MDAQLTIMEEAVQNANTVRDVVIDDLVKRKVISQEYAEDYKIKHHVVLLKKNWFRRAFSKNREDYFCSIISFAGDTEP